MFNNLPAVMFHGTSSFQLPSSLSSVLLPERTHIGKLILATDFDVAAQDALNKTYYDQCDVASLGCQPGLQIIPIVCQIETRNLLNSYIEPVWYTNVPLEHGGCPPRIAYRDRIVVPRTAIIRVRMIEPAPPQVQRSEPASPPFYFRIAS